MKRYPYFFVLIGLLLSFIAGVAHGERSGNPTFVIGQSDFLLDGRPLQIRCGEIHAARVPREYWQHRLQMCKAMGLNTVCAYMFWNFHERTPGEFYWEDRADIAEFCRLAQQEGLWVILRPGPYTCAEWEMGGLPWWLLKHENIQLRSRDPRFLAAARSYLKEVGRVLGPLQVSKGGPILMVQVENEYGFYAKDAEYMGEMRQGLLDAGFEVPLFSCNPVWHLRDGYRKDLFPVVNFGSNPQSGFEALRKILPQGPLMCGEYYSGWFDTWGNPHHTGNTERYLADLEYMLREGASFSIYMAHGGTSFGLWAGADRPFKPDTSCYDYDAPISEAGWVTEKFIRTRELMARYLLPGESLPGLPAPNPVITIDKFELTNWAGLYHNLPNPLVDEQPGSYEKYDVARGCILYRTTLPAGPAAELSAKAVHDVAWASVGGTQIGVFDRRRRRYELKIPARSEPQQLDILVYALGRVNFGKEVHDRKGIHAPVKLEAPGRSSRKIEDWQIFKFPMNDAMLAGLNFTRSSGPSDVGPAFYQGVFQVEHRGDTFLDVSNWGKGIVWVNGRCLGRYWNIGPTQTMYLPGVWLKEGENEVIVLDLIGPTKPTLAGVSRPVLDRLRPELDFAPLRVNRTLVLDGVEPVHQGSFPAGDKLQLVKFSQPVAGRYVCLESRSAHGGKPFAAAAELDLMDTQGRPLSHEGWTIAFVDSEERAKEDGTAENAIDGQTANHWHTEWSNAKPKHPHRLVIDLGKKQRLSALRYVPRAGYLGIGGRIKDYRIYVGDELIAE
ncbi:MAG: beta-galactosidase [Pirellulales bacterium]|nr:beta-galactosidase [Pirellulales bacterium]